MVVSWRLRRATHCLPFRAPVYRGCPRTHLCATESRVTLWQGANPCCVFVGVVTSCVPCAHIRGRASRSCATENTYIFYLDIPSSFSKFEVCFITLWVLWYEGGGCGGRGGAVHSSTATVLTLFFKTFKLLKIWKTFCFHNKSSSNLHTLSSKF